MRGRFEHDKKLTRLNLNKNIKKHDFNIALAFPSTHLTTVQRLQALKNTEKITQIIEYRTVQCYPTFNYKGTDMY